VVHFPQGSTVAEGEVLTLYARNPVLLEATE
jgi:hypothetical protein